MTRYSEAAIRQQIAQRLPDNDLELITPAVERAVMNDLYDSTPGLKDHDAAKTYLQGDTVIYNGDLWKLTTEEAEGEFVQGDWVRVLKVGNARRKAVVKIHDGTLALSAVLGNRYIISGTPLHEMWVELNLQNHDIVEFTADGIIVEHPDEGDIVYVDQLNCDALLIEDGARSWELRPIFSKLHNDLSNRDAAGNHSRISPMGDGYAGIYKADGVTPVFALDTNQIPGVGQILVKGEDGYFYPADQASLPVIIVRGGGANKIYDAVQTAVAGQEVWIFPSNYTEENNIAKEGVIYRYFGANTTKTTAGYLYDYLAGLTFSKSIQIFGNGNFTSTYGVFKINSQTSFLDDIVIEFDTASSSNASVFNGGSVENDSYYLQTVSLRFNKASSASASVPTIKMYGAVMHLDARYINSTGNSAVTFMGAGSTVKATWQVAETSVSGYYAVNCYGTRGDYFDIQGDININTVAPYALYFGTTLTQRYRPAYVKYTGRWCGTINNDWQKMDVFSVTESEYRYPKTYTYQQPYCVIKSGVASADAQTNLYGRFNSIYIQLHSGEMNFYGRGDIVQLDTVSAGSKLTFNGDWFYLYRCITLGVVQSYIYGEVIVNTPSMSAALFVGANGILTFNKPHRLCHAWGGANDAIYVYSGGTLKVGDEGNIWNTSGEVNATYSVCMYSGSTLIGDGGTILATDGKTHAFYNPSGVIAFYNKKNIYSNKPNNIVGTMTEVLTGCGSFVINENINK